MQTATRQHQWVEFAVTPVELLEVEGEHVPVATPGKQPQITYGCMACSMGLDEGKNVACPGQDLFDEE